MIQSSHRFGLAASSPNLSESSLAGWAAVLGFAVLTLGPFPNIQAKITELSPNAALLEVTPELFDTFDELEAISGGHLTEDDAQLFRDGY